MSTQTTKERSSRPSMTWRHQRGTLAEAALAEAALAEVALAEVALAEVALAEVALVEVALAEVAHPRPMCHRSLPISPRSKARQCTAGLTARWISPHL